jgi:hypothetical protein
MDPEYKNESFTTLSIKTSVAQKYRKFSRQIGGSQSSVMERMITFFERHQLSPDDELPNHLIKTEKKLLQRINAVIGIIKDIEKKQTLPTVGILQALFQAELQEGQNKPHWPSDEKAMAALEAELRQLNQNAL